MEAIPGKTNYSYVVGLYNLLAPFGLVYLTKLIGLREPEQRGTFMGLEMLCVKLGCTVLNPIVYVFEKAKEFKSRVIYFTEQPHTHLMPVISGAHCVLMPSRIENFPNACVEAMALNKIVIGTKGVSFEQLINDEINGFLCENANPTDLLSVIEKVVNLPVEKKKEIELNAGETIKRLHPDITIKKLIDYYQSILKR